MLISELAAAFRAGELSPSAVTEHVLEEHPSDAVFRFVTADRARSQAAAADELFRRGIDNGPLQGVPIGIKDLIDTRGEVTTVGSAALSYGKGASADAEVARRLDSAGAVFIGKTTMTELAFSGLGLNQHSAIPRNSLDPLRVPGGSSSGSAVGVGTGALAAAVGSDTGGSVRIPAAFNGLFGLKPTAASIPLGGVASVSPTFDTLGPIAHTANDVWALWKAMRGERGWAFSPRPMTNLRIAVPTTLLLDGLMEEVRSAFEAACENLANKGAAIELVPAPQILDIHATYLQPLSIGIIEAFAAFSHLIKKHEELVDTRVLRRLASGESASNQDLMRLQVQRQTLIESFWKEFKRFDALVAPTVPTLPPLLEPLLSAPEDEFAATNALVVRNTRIANYLGCPAATSPVAHNGHKVPIGFMAMTRPGNEHLALSVALAGTTATQSKKPAK